MKNKKEKGQQEAQKKNNPSMVQDASQERWNYYMLAGIVLVSFIAYLPVWQNEFVNWDDNRYIKDNPLIYSLDLKAIFSTNVAGNYHPLTILMLAFEYHFFKLNETAYHAINLLFHLLNVILVFRVVMLLTMESRIALVASFLFGIHPLHVESVAWAAELKDLMYTFFFLSSYLLYLKFVRNPKGSLYAFVIILFVLSLLSKAMAASLPVVLVLTDYFLGRKFNAKLILEKIPFFILAFIFGAIAVSAQKTAGATDMVVFPFIDRIVFASYGFIMYLVKLVLPLNLSAYYPYPVKVGDALPLLFYAYVLFVLILIGAILYSLRYSRKIFFGVGFFAVTIFLVLQLLPVGGAMMADRYSYLPSLGIFYLAGEGLNALWNKKPKWISTALLIAFGLFFTVSCYARCKVWRNSLALWNDVIEKYQTISHAYNNRCLMHFNYKNYGLAIGDCTKAIQLDNNYSEAYINRGNVYREMNRLPESLSDYNKAAELTPNFYKVYINRGILHLLAQRYQLAHIDFDKTLSLYPKFEEAYYHHGLAYYNERRYDEAMQNYNQAIRIKPNFAMAYYSRAISEFYAGKTDVACTDLKQSAKLGYQVPPQVMSLICK